MAPKVLVKYFYSNDKINKKSVIFAQKYIES